MKTEKLKQLPAITIAFFMPYSVVWCENLVNSFFCTLQIQIRKSIQRGISACNFKTMDKKKMLESLNKLTFLSTISIVNFRKSGRF